jgi:hypothetical protein
LKLRLVTILDYLPGLGCTNSSAGRRAGLGLCAIRTGNSTLIPLSVTDGGHDLHARRSLRSSRMFEENRLNESGLVNNSTGFRRVLSDSSIADDMAEFACFVSTFLGTSGAAADVVPDRFAYPMAIDRQFLASRSARQLCKFLNVFREVVGARA